MTPPPYFLVHVQAGARASALTRAVESKDVAPPTSPEQLYFHGRFPFKYLTDREHGAIKASRGLSTRGGNGQIKPLVGEEEGEHIPQCLQPLMAGLVLKKLYREHLIRLSLHSPNNLVSLERNQDLSSMTYYISPTSAASMRPYNMYDCI